MEQGTAEQIAAGFDESQRLRAAGYPQGTSFFRWYWNERGAAILCPRHERFQWAAKMKTGETDALCDGYPVDWGTKGYDWCDAPSAEEQLRWKPDASLISLQGMRHATAQGKICTGATLANALANSLCEALGVGGYTGR